MAPGWGTITGVALSVSNNKCGPGVIITSGNNEVSDKLAVLPELAKTVFRFVFEELHENMLGNIHSNKRARGRVDLFLVQPTEMSVTTAIFQGIDPHSCVRRWEIMRITSESHHNNIAIIIIRTSLGTVLNHWRRKILGTRIKSHSIFLPAP